MREQAQRSNTLWNDASAQGMLQAYFLHRLAGIQALLEEASLFDMI